MPLDDDEDLPLVDAKLASIIGGRATAALAAAARRMNRQYELDEVFVNGRSGAKVCAVFEYGRPDRRLILKLDRIRDELIENGEFARHVQALADAADTRFLARLAGLPTDPPTPPIEIGGGWWLWFQEVAGGSRRGMAVLTALLAGAPGATLNPEFGVTPVRCDRVLFATTCVSVIDAVLSQWAQQPTLLTTGGAHKDPRRFTASEFIKLVLGNRLDPGTPLRAMADQYPGPTIHLPDEAGPLANPFALALDPSLSPQPRIRIVAGKAHGDLHPENILLRVDSVVTGEPDFVLVDLSRYSRAAPLTRDPTNLLLTIIAHTMGELTAPAARSALIDVLVKPDSDQLSMLPGWLAALIARSHNLTQQWAERHGLGDEWAEQRRLALVPCALRLAVRPWLKADEQAWFLRLAARAATAHLGGAPLVTRVPEPRAPAVSPPDHLGRLCAILPAVRQRRLRSEPELAELCRRARDGEDLNSDLDDLALELKGDTRVGVIDLPAGPFTPETFVCPLTPGCRRTAQRGVDGADPLCAVGRTYMRLRTS